MPADYLPPLDPADQSQQPTPAPITHTLPHRLWAWNIPETGSSVQLVSHLEKRIVARTTSRFFHPAFPANLSEGHAGKLAREFASQPGGKVIRRDLFSISESVQLFQ